MSSIFDNGKTAKQISTVPPEEDNTYELDIHAAACHMVRHGCEDYRYQTHYSSGTTIWADPRGKVSPVSVPRQIRP